MENKFSPYLCGFRKKQLDNGEKVGVIYLYLLKAFDTINHSLLVAKLKEYSFSDQA